MLNLFFLYYFSNLFYRTNGETFVYNKSRFWIFQQNNLDPQHSFSLLSGPEISTQVFSKLVIITSSEKDAHITWCSFTHFFSLPYILWQSVLCRNCLGGRSLPVPALVRRTRNNFFFLMSFFSPFDIIYKHFKELPYLLLYRYGITLSNMRFIERQHIAIIIC